MNKDEYTIIPFTWHQNFRNFQNRPVVVEKLASECEDENWRFRSFLKQIDLDAEELDAIVHRHYHEVSDQIDCRECGNCCRSVQPILHDNDVARLAAGLKLSIEETTEHLLEFFRVGPSVLSFSLIN